MPMEGNLSATNVSPPPNMTFSHKARTPVSQSVDRQELPWWRLFVLCQSDTIWSYLGKGTSTG